MAAVEPDAAPHTMPRSRPELVPALRALDPDWVALAGLHGFAVDRADGAYVSYDGASTISVAPYADLDPDDCLAQIVLHELCHYWCEGEVSRAYPDWGLDNTTDDDLPREFEALEIQRAIIAPFGLDVVLAPTTDFRAWYDRRVAAGAAPSETAVARAAWVLGVSPHRDALIAQLARVARVAGVPAPPRDAGPSGR